MIRFRLALFGAASCVAMAGSSRAQTAGPAPPPLALAAGAAVVDLSALSAAADGLTRRRGLNLAPPVRSAPASAIEPRPGAPGLGLPFRLRRIAGAPYGSGAAMWANGGWSRVETEGRTRPGLRLASGWAGTLGSNAGGDGGRIGAAVGFQDFRDDFGGGAGLDPRGWGGAVYAGYAAPGGAYVQAAAGYAPKVRLNRAARPGAHGAMAASAGRAKAAGASAQVGLTSPALADGWRIGPFAFAEYLDVDLRAAPGRGDLSGRSQNFGRARYAFGLEGFGRWAFATPSFQLAYAHADQVGERNAALVLRRLGLPFAGDPARIGGLDRDYGLAAAALDGVVAGFAWRASVEERISRRSELRAGFGVSRRF